MRLLATLAIGIGETDAALWEAMCRLEKAHREYRATPLTAGSAPDEDRPLDGAVTRPWQPQCSWQSH